MSAFQRFAAEARPSWGKSRRLRADKYAHKFKIERGIPIPPARAHNGAPIQGYAGVLRLLNRGDSVVLPVSQSHANALAARIIGAGNYTTRRAGDGMRIWRTR